MTDQLQQLREPDMSTEQLHEAVRLARRMSANGLTAEEEDQAAAILRRVPELEAELERERMRLAACGVVALANTPESAAKARDMHDDYKSASCDDVARMVDEQMNLRAELSAMRAQGARVPDGSARSFVEWVTANLDGSQRTGLHDALNLFESALSSSPTAPQADAGPHVDRSDAVNLARNMLDMRDCKGITEHGVRVLCDAIVRMDAAINVHQVKPAPSFSGWIETAGKPSGQLDWGVHVCAEKDIVCGDKPANWCSKCPKRATQHSEGAKPYQLLRDALRLARDALVNSTVLDHERNWALLSEAQKAIESALFQPTAASGEQAAQGVAEVAVSHHEYSAARGQWRATLWTDLKVETGTKLYTHPSPAVAVPDDSIRNLIAAHAGMLDANPYCYFELAYTRQTEWMAWICSKPREDDPSRKVLAQGQGFTPDEAASNALAALATQQGGG